MAVEKGPTTEWALSARHELRKRFAPEVWALNDLSSYRVVDIAERTIIEKATPSVETRRKLQAYIHWRVPGETGFIDPRLFHAFRLRYPDGNVPLVVEIEPVKQVRYSKEWEQRRYAEIAWLVERNWLLGWKGVPDGSRPGLVVLSGGTGTVLASGVEPRSQPGLAALACFPLVTTRELELVEKALGRTAPSKTERSRALEMLRAERLLVGLDVNPMTGKSRRRGEITVHLNLVAHAIANSALRRAGVPDDESRSDLPKDRDARHRILDRQFSGNLGRWKDLVDQLHNYGLQTVPHPAAVPPLQGPSLALRGRGKPRGDSK
jgi:hypothetical protein